MEFYLDDCADSNLLAAMMRKEGHQVYTPRTEGTRGIVDPMHLQHAASRGYALITKNPEDFRHLHHEWQARSESHSGILLICEDNNRVKDMEPADIVLAIGKLLKSGVPITNELHVLNHWR